MNSLKGRELQEGKQFSGVSVRGISDNARS